MRHRQHFSGQPGSDIVRTFISIDLPEAIKNRLDSLQKTLREIEAQVSWTKPSNIHLTLKFLGSVEASRIESISKAVGVAAREIRPFEIEISGSGCFPSPQKPRVLWVGFSNVPAPLRQLHSNIEHELASVGFPLDTRSFSPHLTIGRIRTPHNAARVAQALISQGFEAEGFTVREVNVMRSDLRPTGSIYTVQGVIQLE